MIGCKSFVLGYSSQAVAKHGALVDPMAHGPSFTPQLFVRYWIACVALVLLTYNPFGRSFYHWVAEGSSEEIFLKLVVGLSLLFGYVFLIWVILGSLGALGVTVGLLLWGLLSYQVLDWLPTDEQMLRHFVMLVCLATLLAVGLSWPHFVYRLTGQIEKRYLTKNKKKPPLPGL